MADETLGTGSISKHIPKDYPVSPDIEDRRNEPKPDVPTAAGFAPVEVVIKSKPGYQEVHKARKKLGY